MLPGMFCRYALRTTDADAARVFYAEAIGLALPDGRTATSALEAWPLHERARAAGAPAHWLGMIGVADVDAMVGRLVERGSQTLGPTARPGDGSAFAVVRDPTGAVVGVRAPAETVGTSSPVAWHQLHTADLDRAWATYAELFGWAHTHTLDVADPVGGHRLFAWDDAAGPAIGSMANTARWAGVHSHWLFYFAVADVAAAVSRVRRLGGTAMEPIELPGAGVLSACEDPQGAAFGVAGGVP